MKAVEPFSNRFPNEIFKYAQRVLLIDNEPFIGELLKSTLSELGHLFVGRIHDHNYLDHTLSNQQIDLVVINIELDGELNGIQIAKLIKIEHDIPFYFACRKYCKDLIEYSSEINPDGYIHFSKIENLKNQLIRILD